MVRDTEQYPIRYSQAQADLGGGIHTLNDSGQVPAITPELIAQMNGEALPSGADRINDELSRADRDARLNSSISTAADVNKLSVDQRELNIRYIHSIKEANKRREEPKIIPKPSFKQ